MRQIESVRKFALDFDRTLTAVESAPPFEFTAGTEHPDDVLDALRGGRRLETLRSPADFARFDEVEAIILDRLRPSYLILEDKIQIHGEYDHGAVLETNKETLEAITRGVGRVDLFHHSTLSYAGTGWLVEKDIAVTNRHVANIFTDRDWLGRYVFAQGAFGEAMEARMDYVRQSKSSLLRRRADILEVLYIAGPREPDIAFLRVETHDDVEPLVLHDRRAEPEQPVAVVGYPASDGMRNNPDLMKKLFQGIYDVKRFAPGLITGHTSEGVVVLSDYTSLGGNSGSPVLDLQTGNAVGLHFAGAFRETNRAVASDIVAAALSRMKISVTVEITAEEEAPTSGPSRFEGRDGYRAGFLGEGKLTVQLPALGRWMNDIAPVSDNDQNILNYRHFSVIQSASRRLPLLTAVNINGNNLFRLKRRGSWRLDGRIAPEHQIGNELYARNPLDRGHMVRRRDPGWGFDRDEAQEAEVDTFHYTNCAPQHKDLNQRDWVGIEDYILEAAETRDFKVSVFTGPIFHDNDRLLLSQPGAEDIQIPEEYWKIAVMVNAATGDLSATGYILTQGRMIRYLTEAAFVLGQYETYQVQIARIEEETGLDFGTLRNADPIGAELSSEAPFVEVVRRISGPSDLLL